MMKMNVRVYYTILHKSKDKTNKRMKFEPLTDESKILFQQEMPDFWVFIHWLATVRFRPTYIPRKKEKRFNKKEVLVVELEGYNEEYYFFKKQSEIAMILRQEFFDEVIDEYEHKKFKEESPQASLAGEK